MALGEQSATGAFDRDIILMVNNPIKNPQTGSLINVWSKGPTIRGALSILQTSEAILAQAQTGIAVGILAVNKVYDLPMNTYIQDTRDGNYYRISSPGQTSSDALSLQQTQYSVVWVPSLPA